MRFTRMIVTLLIFGETPTRFETARSHDLLGMTQFGRSRSGRCWRLTTEATRRRPGFGLSAVGTRDRLVCSVVSAPIVDPSRPIELFLLGT